MRNKIERPMTRTRRWALAVAIAAAVGEPVPGGALTTQSQPVVPPAGVAFQTVSVKPSKQYGPGNGPYSAHEASVLRRFVSPGVDGRFTTEGYLHSLIQAAYNVSALQVEGGPSWVHSERYAIEARTVSNATPDQVRGMLQSMLADRFKLTLRRETRSMPVYELVVANGGLKIAAMKPEDCIPMKAVQWDVIDGEKPLYICNGSRRRILSQSPETRPRVTRIEAGSTSISNLIIFISPDVDRVVFDKTGLTAPFNLVLDFVSPRDAGAGPTIFTAIEEQLGLRLVATEGPVEVLVIDRAERPSQN